MSTSFVPLNSALGIGRSTFFDDKLLLRILAELDVRFKAVFDAAESLTEAEDLIRQITLDRINEVLTPAIESVLNIQERGFLIAKSASENTLGIGDILTFVVDDLDERSVFTPSPFVALTREDNTDDWGIARTIGYSNESGELLVEVLSFNGDEGPHEDWVIGALAGSTIAQQTMLAAAEVIRSEIDDARIAVADDRGAVAADKAAVAGDRATTVTAKNTAVSAAESAEASKDAAADSAAAATSAVLVNKPTDPSRPLKVRTIAEWADALGVMSDTTNDGLSEAAVEAIATGRRVFVPEGSYDVTSAVLFAALTKPLRLEFDPQARLNVNASLRNGIFRGSAAGQPVEIDGGVWDATDQPIANPGIGESWGIVHVTDVKGGGIDRAVFIAGADYRDEKSDSAVFATGEAFCVSRCRFVGFSDASIYLSGGSSGQGTTGLKVTDNDFYGCSVAVIVKRTGLATVISGNSIRKSSVGIASGSAEGSGGLFYAGGKRMIISGNQIDDCITPMYLEWADGSVVDGNRIRGWGTLLDGTVHSGTKGAIRLLGTQGARICDNRILSTMVANDVDLHGILMQGATVQGVTQNCLYNTIADNDIDAGANTAGRALYETAGSNHNHFVDNRLLGTWTLPEVVAGGSTLIEKREASGRKVLVIGATERVSFGAADVDFTPPDGGKVRIARNGVAAQNFEIFEDGSGAHLRGNSTAAAAKVVSYESNADGTVTGGELGHRFLVGGVQKTKITATKMSSDISLFTNYADDTAAAGGGIAVGDWYRTGSVLKIRVA